MSMKTLLTTTLIGLTLVLVGCNKNQETAAPGSEAAAPAADPAPAAAPAAEPAPAAEAAPAPAPAAQ